MTCLGHDTNCNCDGSCHTTRQTAFKFAQDGAVVWRGRGWQTRAAKHLDVTPQTVNNWVCGRTPIPGAVLQLLEKLVAETKNGVDNAGE